MKWNNDEDLQQRIVLFSTNSGERLGEGEYICKEWYERWIEYSAIIQIRKRFVLQCVCVRRAMMGSSSFLFLTFLLVNFSGTIGTGFTQDWIRGS